MTKSGGYRILGTESTEYLTENMTKELTEASEKDPAGDRLEAEEGLERKSGDVYPDATVKISRDQYSVFEIKRMAEETHDLQIAPPFQRRRVWRIEQNRELIESILMGIPIPVIYVFEDENGKKQVVDGRQRISAIIDFLNNKFTLDKLRMLPAFNGKKFSDLDPIYKSKVERYQIPVYVIEPPTPERVKYDIFDRVNRGGTRLNNQEMRNALYQGPATELLNELSRTEEFKAATGNGVKATRMRDKYIILRFLSFYLLRTRGLDFSYKSNSDELLAAAMKRINAMPGDEINALQNVFIHSMRQCHAILGRNAFRFSQTNVNRRPVNMALFEAIAYFFATARIDAHDHETLKKRLEALKEEFDRSGNFISRVDSSNAVEYRFSMVEKLAREAAC